MITNTIQFEAFKEVNSEQATAMQDAFANVFTSVCDDMELGDIPKELQSKCLWLDYRVCVCVCVMLISVIYECVCLCVCVCVCVCCGDVVCLPGCHLLSLRNHRHR